MKKSILKKWISSSALASLLLVSCGEANSQKTEEKTDKKESTDRLDDDGQTLFWKISGNGLEQPSYLYGTMHMIDEEHFVMGKQMQEKFAESDALVMEIENIMTAALKSASLMKLDSGHVSDYFTPEQYDTIIRWAETEMGMDKASFDASFGGMKPFAIMQIITQKQFKGDTKSYELEFIKMATEQDKKMLGFETVEQQIGFFDQIPAEEFAKMLMETIREANNEEGNGMMEDMTRLYKEQKTDSLLTFMLKSSPEMMQYEDLLLNDRNANWIPQIEEIIKDKKAFIAVGAAHLLGDKGVIELLKKQGYELTPLATE